MSDALTDDSTDVVKGLAHMAAERCLKSLELAADLHGVGTHIFPSVGNEESHALTVTYYHDMWAKPFYSYRLRVPSAPKAGGVIDRETALKMLATDKEIRADA